MDQSLVSHHAPGRLRPSQGSGEALAQVLPAAAVTIASVSAFAVSTKFGVAATFLLVLLISNALPAAIPATLICVFLYQNLVVAWFTPFVTDNIAFDALRGANFVVLMTAYAVFLAASFQYRLRAVTQLRPWLLVSFILSGTIGVYLVLGALHGNAKDAIVYFRNTITPLACFHIAVVAASLYRVDLRKSVRWLGAGIILYGYCELIFTMGFLGLFHGDLYIERDLHRQIETGAWEKTMHETGFVLRGLKDVMMTDFFNTQAFGNLFPQVFRIGGPNFHPISYAYALAIIAAWLIFSGSWLLPLAALPLLLVIGSKGATFMLVVAILARLAHRRLGTGLTLAGVLALSFVWVAAAIGYGATHGDYHVLGFLAGLKGFAANPLGRGLGLGGNLSSTSLHVDWEHAQATGATSIPVESAVGVMLYQMGIGSFVFFGFLAALAVAARRLLKETGNPDFLFAFVGIVTISANAVLQEEAFYSPLALAFCLLLAGVAFGTHWRETSAIPKSWRRPPQKIAVEQ
jgi:hypothetical protein